MAQQFVKLISLDSRNLLPVKHLLIKTIYSIENNRDYTAEHWLKRIDDIFNKKSVRNTSGEFYITPIFDKVNKTGEVTSWCVYPTKFLNPSPRSKYFSFERYGGRDIALKEAIAYRDSVINKWFTEHGYVSDPLIMDNDS